MGEARRRKLKDPNYGKIPKATKIAMKKQADLVVLVDKIFNTVEGRLEEVPTRFKDNRIKCITSFAEFTHSAMEKVNRASEQNAGEGVEKLEYIQKIIEKIRAEYQVYLQDYSAEEKEYLIIGLTGKDWIDSYQLIDVVTTQNHATIVEFIKENKSTFFRGWLNYQFFKPFLREEYLKYQPFWDSVQPFL